MRSIHAHILPYHPDFLLMYCNTKHSTFNDVLSLFSLFNINFMHLNFSFSTAGTCICKVAINMARRGIQDLTLTNTYFNFHSHLYHYICIWSQTQHSTGKWALLSGWEVVIWGKKSFKFLYPNTYKTLSISVDHTLFPKFFSFPHYIAYAGYGTSLQTLVTHLSFTHALGNSIQYYIWMTRWAIHCAYCSPR